MLIKNKKTQQIVSTLLTFNWGVILEGNMVTRREHSRRVKQKRLINKVLTFLGISVSIILLIVSFIDNQYYDIELVSKKYKCKLNACDYRITIHNTTKLRKLAFVWVTAHYRKTHPKAGDTFPVVNSERIEVNLEPLEEKELTGSIKIPFNGHFVKFRVGSK